MTSCFKSSIGNADSGRIATAITGFMLAPFLWMVGGTSILRGLRAGAKQVGESSNCCGVGVFHAASVLFICPQGVLNRVQKA